MRFSIATVLAFAASAFAQAADFDPIYTPKANEVVPAGAPFTVTWEAPAKYLDGTITIELIGGATQNTQTKLSTIATGVKNSAKTYSWNVDASLGDLKFYGLVFRYETNPTVTFQYSNPFSIKASENKPTGSGTVTMTKSHGIKTVTLSTTSTPVTTTSAPATTSHSTTSVQLNTTVPCNSTTLVIKPSTSNSGPVVVTSTAVVGPTTTAPTTAPVPTSAASAVRVGALTILGAIAAALAL